MVTSDFEDRWARRDHRVRERAPGIGRWTKITEQAAWKNPAEVRNTFRTVDFVGGKAVFNIGGNKYRLIALIIFERQVVIVQAVLTHKEYDRGKWK